MAQTSLNIGATSVPHAEILNIIKPDLAQQGIRLDIIEFSDYMTPNIALVERQLDVNFFQHLPYLESFTAARKLSRESVVAALAKSLTSAKVKDFILATYCGGVVPAF
jgi:D-methionine transport system substrate-binding protein